MTRLLFAGALILLLTGCGGEPAAAKVAFVETRIDESQSPTPFVIALANAGDAATDVDRIGMDVVESVVLPGSGKPAEDAGPAVVRTGDCRIEMREGHPTALPAQGDGVACGFVKWDRPEKLPPAVAAVSARFRVTLADGESIETPAEVFLLSSEAGQAALAIDGLALDREQALATLERVESLPGERTPTVERLVEDLKRLSK